MFWKGRLFIKELEAPPAKVTELTPAFELWFMLGDYITEEVVFLSF
jgi:hypothetical protein